MSRLLPDFQITAHTATALLQPLKTRKRRRLYAVQFHPEVLHTAEGTKMLRNFVYDVCGCSGDWKMDSFVENTIKALREQIGEGGAAAPVRRRGLLRAGRSAGIRPSASS